MSLILAQVNNFAWVKKQPSRTNNLIAHINVEGPHAIP